jgi:hypothetical protein
MTTHTPKDRAALALAEVRDNARTVPEAVGIVAALAAVAPGQVISDVRATRYLIYNASCPGPLARAMLDDLPPDVVPIPYGWRAVEEEGQARLLAAMAVGISSLPAVYVYVPARTIEGEDGPELLAAHYEEVRLDDAKGWEEDAAPADRCRSPTEWALKRTPPPPEQEVQ